MSHREYQDFREAWNNLIHEYAKALGIYHVADWIASRMKCPR
jgi:hypothetical protein